MPTTIDSTPGLGSEIEDLLQTIADYFNLTPSGTQRSDFATAVAEIMNADKEAIDATGLTRTQLIRRLTRAYGIAEQ